MASIPDMTVHVELSPEVRRLIEEEQALRRERGNPEPNDGAPESWANKPPHKFDVMLTPSGHRSRIFMDGKELHAVRSFAVKCEVNAATTVKLEMYAGRGSLMHLESHAFETAELVPLRTLEMDVVDKLLRLIEAKGEEGAAMALDRALELSANVEPVVRATPELAVELKKVVP